MPESFRCQNIDFSRDIKHAVYKIVEESSYVELRQNYIEYPKQYQKELNSNARAQS